MACVEGTEADDDEVDDGTCCLTSSGCDDTVPMPTGLGTANFVSALVGVVKEERDCGVFGPCIVFCVFCKVFGVHEFVVPPLGVGGLLGDGFDIDIGESILEDSTDFNLFGGGAVPGHEFKLRSSCLTSCLIETGFQDALASIVTSSTSVLKRKTI